MSWLHKTTRYAAASAIRSRVRRIRHESRAAVLRIEAVPAINAGEWDGRLPMLDELVGRLSRADREVILLRYYRQMAFADVGVQIGTTAEAARKRVDRAVEKLRVIANQSGWALSATLLREGLSRHVVVGPPGGLPARIAMTVSHNVGSAIGASTAAIVKGAGAMMVSAQLKLVAALVRRLRAANERISRQSFQTVPSRVAGVLSQLVAEETPRQLAVRVTSW
jgi:hypothetical protein